MLSIWQQLGLALFAVSLPVIIVRYLSGVRHALQCSTPFQRQEFIRGLTLNLRDSILSGIVALTLLSCPVDNFNTQCIESVRPITSSSFSACINFLAQIVGSVVQHDCAFTVGLIPLGMTAIFMSMSWILQLGEGSFTMQIALVTDSSSGTIRFLSHNAQDIECSTVYESVRWCDHEKQESAAF
jgi:hypothetical protein